MSLRRLLYFGAVACVFCCSGTGFSQANTTSGEPARASGKTGKNAAPEQPFHEEWNTPSLAGSHLTAHHPLIEAKDILPDYKFVREVIQLQWRPYDSINLYVVRPEGVVKPPVILYLYSFPQGPERFHDSQWCAAATSGGYAAVGFVSMLTDPRIYHRTLKESFISEMQESLATSAHDVPMILDYLASRGDLDMDHVGMLGQGSGGTIAILASAAEPRIKALDVLTPWGDWPNWFAKSVVVPPGDRSSYTTPEFLAKVGTLDPVDWLAKVKAQAVRIQNVRRSGVVPDESEERIEAAAPGSAKINQYGDGLAFFPHAAGGGLFDWLKEQLNPEGYQAKGGEATERVHFYPAVAKSDRPVLPQ